MDQVELNKQVILAQQMLASIPKFDSFGDALRYCRATTSDRLRRIMPGIGATHMTNQSVVNCLTSSGYEISQSTYSELENGRSLPRDPDLFLEKLCPCMAIERNSLPYWLLRQQLGFDLVKQRLGADEAAALVIMDRVQLVKSLLEKDKLLLDS